VLIIDIKLQKEINFELLLIIGSRIKRAIVKSAMAACRHILKRIKQENG
jgi:hypothetical protein